jgi:electron transfer flavoprotein beta subunit
VKIVVLYKWCATPDQARVADDGSVEWSGADAGLSEYDPVAMEVARRLADAWLGQGDAAEVVGVSVGGPEVASSRARKACLSRGLDRAVVVADASLAHAGTARTGAALAAVVDSLTEVCLVLAGDASADEGAGLTPAVVAGLLGWPSLTEVRSLSGRPGDLMAAREVVGGAQRLRVRGPAVLSVAPDAVTPRNPGMQDILAAAKKPMDQAPLAGLRLAPLSAQGQEVGRRRPRSVVRGRVLIDGTDPRAAADELARALRAAGVG